MDNSFLRDIHLANKKRRNPNLVEDLQQAPVVAAVPSLPIMMLCLDLTGEDLDPQIEKVEEEQHEPPPPRVVRRRAPPRVLPEQDQVMLLETEEEFGEVLRRHTSLDRLEKHRGDNEKNAITISEDLRCDCIQKCKDGYECYAEKHVMCKNMLTKDRKCYLCGSRVL